MHRLASAVFRHFCVFAWLTLGCAAAAPAMEPPVSALPELLTNLAQLRVVSSQSPQEIHPFRVVAEVVEADSTNDLLVLRDASAVEFLRVDFKAQKIEPGARVCLEGHGCAVRPDGFGLEIVPGLVVDDDGVHPAIPVSGRTFLHAGRNPITVKWFNWFGEFGLNLEYEGQGIPRQLVPAAVLSRLVRDPETGRANFSSGLEYRCYEGVWQLMPDFAKLRPVKSGVATNIDCNLRTRDIGVGLEFNGFITVPADGIYTFHLASDDGGELFAGDSTLEIQVLSKQPAPAVSVGLPSARSHRGRRLQVMLEGEVISKGDWNTGGELQLRVGNEEIPVEIFQNCNAASTVPVQGRVRAYGIYEDVLDENDSRASGRLLVLNWSSIQAVASSETAAKNSAGSDMIASQQTPGSAGAPADSTIKTAAEIKALSPETAKLELPVSIRGVVTFCNSKFIGGVVQDSTKGVFIDMRNFRDAEPLRRGERYQIDGVTGPGLFAPVIVARRITHLGPGRLPAPVRVTWDQLGNGSLDTQFAEIEGIVTAVHDRQVVLLLQGGKTTLDLSDLRAESLPAYQNALIRIRGCVFVNFNQETHKLGTGVVVIRAPTIEVLQAMPREIFEVPQRSIGELLLYDPKAAPFRLLKTSGQVIHAEPGEFILSDGTNGMRVTTRNSDSFSAGDLVDAVGYLKLGGSAIELKEAVMRKTGSAPLRAPIRLPPDQLLQASNVDMFVEVEATLMDQWHEGAEQVLALQSGFLAFKARVDSGGRTVSLPPSGSRLALSGAYSPQGNPADDGTVSGFELLLPSPKVIRVLATPPWLNLKHLVAIAGILAAMLLAVLIWNKELHRKVQERGRQLELEINNRQRAELQHAAEAERARIARDLHDELGTGLTEVSLLAGTGVAESQGTEKSHDRFQTIAEKARALVSGLDVIVWAIDPKRNSLQSFADYLGRYATELFSSTNIVCRFNIPIECEAIVLSEAARHSLFLAVKEALNNVIRHASATEMELQISQSNSHLQIVIADNGSGFDREKIYPGNGLANLEQRLEALSGECHIESSPGKGTAVKFTVPLPGKTN